MFCRSRQFVVGIAALAHALANPCLLRAEESLQDRVGALVQPYLDNHLVMGMAVGVLQQDYSTTLGYGRLSAENSRRPDGRTIFEIASVSKVFTGLLLADAVVQDRLELDQPAAELLPAGVKLPEHEKRAITLQDLATHVSGLPRLPASFSPADWSNPYADYSGKKLAAFLNRYQLTRAPGEKSEYSNLGMGLLGQLLSFEAKTPYQQLLRERIAKPLEMSDTTITLTKNQTSRVAPPHLADNQPGSHWDFLTLAGAGGIRSTTSDMLKFAQAQLSPPESDLGQAIELAWQVHQKPLAAADFALGLGWHLARDGNTRWHNGQTGGYHSMLLVSRKLDLAVVLLTNTATGEVDRLAQDIFSMLAGANIAPRSFEEAITVPPEVMQRYVGTYQLTPSLVFTVKVEDDKLMIDLTGQPALQVFPRSETEWFYKVVPASITFQVDAQGKCTSLELSQNGARQRATRTE